MEKCRLEKCHGANFMQSWIKKNSTIKNENAKMLHLIERKFPFGDFLQCSISFFSAEALKTGLQTVSYWVAAPPNLFTTSNFSPLAFFHLLQNMAI